MEIHINKRKIVNWFWIILIALNLIGFAAKAINKLLGHKYDHFVRLVDVSEEANLTTWFSVELFFVSAVLLLLIAMAKKTTGDRWARHWTWLSVIFFALSIDDLAQLHEMTIKPLRATLHTSGLFYYSWVVIAIPLCLFTGLMFLRFVLSLPRDTRIRFIVAGTIFITGNILVEMVSGVCINKHLGSVPIYPIVTSLEELGKYAGLVLFISALGTYMTTQPEMRSISWKFASLPGPDACEAEPTRVVDEENAVAAV